MNGTGMKTFLYLIRHGATEANLARPPWIPGRKHDLPLARLGIRQAELTRDFLAIRPIEHCYCSPLLRAVQTAAIVAGPHGLSPVALESLTECDAGRWEGLDWQTIRRRDPETYERFLANSSEQRYPEGESFGDVYRRVSPTLEELLTRHGGQAFLVVGHDAVNRAYLAGLLGLTPNQARQVAFDNCGISIVIREGQETTVNTLNAAFHLQGVAA